MTPVDRHHGWLLVGVRARMPVTALVLAVTVLLPLAGQGARAAVLPAANREPPDVVGMTLPEAQTLIQQQWYPRFTPTIRVAPDLPRAGAARGRPGRRAARGAVPRGQQRDRPRRHHRPHRGVGRRRPRGSHPRRGPAAGRRPGPHAQGHRHRPGRPAGPRRRNPRSLRHHGAGGARAAATRGHPDPADPERGATARSPRRPSRTRRRSPSTASRPRGWGGRWVRSSSPSCCSGCGRCGRCARVAHRATRPRHLRCGSSPAPTRPRSSRCTRRPPTPSCWCRSCPAPTWAASP